MVDGQTHTGVWTSLFDETEFEKVFEELSDFIIEACKGNVEYLTAGIQKTSVEVKNKQNIFLPKEKIQQAVYIIETEEVE